MESIIRENEYNWLSTENNRSSTIEDNFTININGTRIRLSCKSSAKYPPKKKKKHVPKVKLKI